MPERVVDLRSDTLTQPSPAMREAMYRAELGDDMYGEDPTVNRLEEMTAELLGKEAAVLLLSGTMGNLVGLLAQTRRGDEVILGDAAHVVLAESAGSAVIGGLQLRPVPTNHGRFDLADIVAAIRPLGDVHQPPSTLLCLENTHNRDGGVPVTPADTRAMARVAHEHGLRVHLDGARLFNAAVALDVPAADLVADVDSVTFCLSKGLSCPMGSLLAGDADYITQARRYRKMVGGALRQSGVIAAAGIIALEQMIHRLAEDHEHAQRLAQGLANIPGLAIDPDDVESNLVFVDVDPAWMSGREIMERSATEGVKFGGKGDRIRLVLHYGITSDDVDYALAAIERVMADVRVPAAV
ncbi:MAG: low specificity L-threonine aldolase [Dehalococcoidia bacterium]|nr:low specificity L-threonine aldolase [Dehalococcoidia bacterium]